MSAMLGLKVCPQLPLPCSSLAVRYMSSLHALLGASPADSSSNNSSSAPESSIPPDHSSHSMLEQQPGVQLPSLCGEPKNKLSIHRRGNRRISYYSQRQELFAECKHCGLVGMPHQYLAANKKCTGQCLQPPTKSYPREYKPPC